jgi:threonine synthase
MNYYSLNYNSSTVGFLEAVRKGLAPDRGLYFPETIPSLPKDFIESIPELSNHELAFSAITPFIGEDIPEDRLRRIVEETLSFDFPIVPITQSIASLELFQGPTLAFKDVGARFMARCLAYAHEVQEQKKLTILVATSGDTGGAVADGFYKVNGIDVVILYPKGKVSEVQEKQLTTLGENITALEVDGTFDDCQNMVKSAFIDPELTNQVALTSANSINIARWLAQMFYFFIAYKNRTNPEKDLVVSVPSGNFGNLCAGIMAQKMGLPIKHFIASTNVNDTVPSYLSTGNYVPKKSISTLSNAMDVGDPSNFIRIQKLFNNDFHKLKKLVSGFAYTDPQTKKALKEIYKTSNYIADPHGAVSYLGLKDYLNSQERDTHQGIFFETAHPIKFAPTVESTLKLEINPPKQVESLLNKPKLSLSINDYKALKEFFLAR